MTCRCSAYPFPHRWTGGKCTAPAPVTILNHCYYVTPDPICKICHGRGTFLEWHPQGDTVAAEELTCDCVSEQLPEEFDFYKNVVEIK